MKKYERIIAIDHGYDSVKVFDGNRIFKFKSQIEEVGSSESFVTGEDTYKVQYKGRNYIIGNGAAHRSIDYDKTGNENSKIFTLLSLAKLMTDSVGTFRIVAGYPLNLYSSNKDVFSEYLKTDYTEVLVDDVLKHISISDSVVFPQGAGALFSNPIAYQNRLVAVLDIGGLTVNGCIFDNFNLQTPSMFTANLGCLILLNQIRKELNSHFTLNLQEYEVINVIKNGLIINGKRCDSSKIVNSMILNHCHQIKTECQKSNWNIETLDVIIVGGGGLFLDGYIQKVIPQVKIIPDPVAANVRGFYEVGRRYYAQNI